MAEDVDQKLWVIGAERDLAMTAAKAWEETARDAYKSLAYYQNQLRRVGMLFGAAAYTADDGSVHDAVLLAKVPELVHRLYLAAVSALRDHPELADTFKGLVPPDPMPEE